MFETFPELPVIGESLLRIPASSLVAARAGDGGRRLVSRDESVSEAPRQRRQLWVDGGRHPSTSPWCVIPELLGIRKELRGGSKS